METSSRRRQASSSWARVLGGGRGGMAGSWMKGWAGWWLRRWPQLPPPPHVCVWVEEAPKDFLLLWLLCGGERRNQQHVQFMDSNKTSFKPRALQLTCETYACLAFYFPGSTATRSGWGLLCRWAAEGAHRSPCTSLLCRPQPPSDRHAWTESWNAYKGEGDKVRFYTKQKTEN